MGRTSNKVWKQTVAVVREAGRGAGLPCAICRGALGPIDYRTREEADADARATGEWWLVGAHRPLGLSVDHIVPHAAGGTDTIDNAQQAHAVCNSRAQDKGRTRARRDAAERPVNGYWKPVDGVGEPLPGRAIPGAQQGRHVFVAGPGEGTARLGFRTGPHGIARPPSTPEKPRSA